MTKAGKGAGAVSVYADVRKVSLSADFKNLQDSTVQFHLIHFVSAAVAVNFSHMTASSSTSWSSADLHSMGLGLSGNS